MDCSLQGSSARGILQARILEWVAVLSSWVLMDPGVELAFLMSPVLAGRLSVAPPQKTGQTWVQICCLFPCYLGVRLPGFVPWSSPLNSYITLN